MLNVLRSVAPDLSAERHRREVRTVRFDEEPVEQDLADRFGKLEKFDAASGEEMVKELSQGNGMGPWVHPIRVAVSGRMDGPGLFEMLELIGKERTIARLRNAAEKYAL